MNRFVAVLLPELRRFPPAEQAQALRTARDTPLDVLELLGMATGLVLVTALTRHVWPDGGAPARFATVLLNFAAALPLLALVLGPFHLRRLRRGLRDELRRRSPP